MHGTNAARVRQTHLDGCQEEEGFDSGRDRLRAEEEGDRG